MVTEYDRWRYSLNIYGDIEINTFVGEANPEQLRETTLDPNNRILVQFTMDDCLKAMKIFEKLQGNKAVDKAARKKMMSEYKIDRDDLDN